MVKVRGLSLLANMAYVEKKGVADKVLASLDEKLGKLYTNLKAHEWYSYEEVDLPLERAADNLVAKGDERFFIDMGKFNAEYNARWYLQLFFKFVTPQKMVKKFPTLWNIYFDTGKLYIHELNKTSTTIRLVEVEIAHLTHLIIVGWGEYASGMAGAKKVQIVETKCNERGDEYTEWKAKWV
jgi:hypothetical protein